MTGSLADALNWAGISEDQFNESLAACSTEEERSALITQTLSEIYDDAGQAYRETNEALVEYRESQARSNEAAADAGNALLPLATMLRDVGTALLQWATPGLQGFSDFMTTTAMPAVQGFGDFVGGTVVPALEKWSPLLLGIATMFGVLTVAVNLNNISNAILAVQWTLTSGAMTAAATAQALLNSTMLANPITWVVALLAGLVAAFIYLWNTSEEFRNFWISLWENVKSAVSSAVSAISGLLNDMASTASAAFNFVLSTASSVWGSITSTISNAINSARDAVGSAIEKIKGFFSFTVSWPHIPMPHFSISPGGWKVGDLLQGVIPKLGISWYAHGGYFPDPKIVGIGDSEGGEYALPANMRSQFTRDFARAIAADMPGVDGAIGGRNEYNITITFDISKLKDIVDNFDGIEEFVRWIKRTQLMYPTRT